MKFFIILSCLFIFSCASSHDKILISQQGQKLDSLQNEIDSLVIITKEDSSKLKNQPTFFKLDSCWEIVDQITDTNFIIIAILNDGENSSQFFGSFLLKNKTSNNFFLISETDFAFLNFNNAVWFQVFKISKKSLKSINKKKDLET